MTPASYLDRIGQHSGFVPGRRLFDQHDYNANGKTRNDGGGNSHIKSLKFQSLSFCGG